jgi:ABC-type polysaccharide/polyol phosphate export permease
MKDRFALILVCLFLLILLVFGLAIFIATYNAPVGDPAALVPAIIWRITA